MTPRSAAPTSTSTRSPRTAPPASPRSSTTSSARPSSTSSRSPTTSGSTPRSPPGRSPRTAACAFEVIVGEEITTRGGHLLGLFLERADPAAALAALDDRRGPRPGRPRDPRPPARAYPLCAQGWCSGACSATRPRWSAPTRSRRSTRRRSGGRWHGRVVRVRGRARPGRGRQQRRPRARGDRHGLDDVPGPDARRTCGRAILERQTQLARLVPRAPAQLAMFGRQLRSTAATRGRTSRGRVRRDGTGRDLGYPGGAPAPAAVRAAPQAQAEDRGPMKIGLVTPYIYPLPGRRHAARPLPLREPAPARPRRPDHHQHPRPPADAPRATSSGSARASRCPTNGSVGTLTVSPRYVSQVRDVLEREQFDLLHFHEPFVPFLSLVLLRESKSVNVATFHAYAGFSPAYEFGSKILGGYAERLHGRIAVSAAARHFIDRYFPGDYKVIPNGVDVDRFRRAVPIARWQDGTPNILFVGRLEPRKGLLDLLKAYRHPAQDRLRVPAAARRLGAAGARGAALRRDPPAAAASSSSAASATTRRRSCSPPPTSTSRRPPAANRSGSCCSRRWPPARRSSAATSTATRASSARDARPCSCRRATRRRSRRPSPQLLGDPRCGRRWRRAGRARAEEFSWERVTAKVDDYYGFVIRRLAAGDGCRSTSAPIPPPPRPRRPCAAPPLRSPGATTRRRVSASARAASPRREPAARSASAIRQTQAP